MWAHFINEEFQSLPALNGKDYPIRGTFTDVGTGLGAINIIIGNNTKQA